MRKILLLLFSLLATVQISAQEDTLLLGYCKGQVASSGKSTPKGREWVSGAIKLGPDQLQPYAGNKISEIRIGLCSRINIDTLRVWVRSSSLLSDNVTSGEITTHSVPAIRKGWNVVELSLPYDIKGSETLLVGFDFKQRGSTPALSFTGKAAKQTSFLKEQETGTWKDAQKYGNISIEAVITGNNLPQYDLALSSASALYNPKTGKMNITAQVYNAATRPVQGFTLSTSVSGMSQPFVTHFNTLVNSGKTESISYSIQPDNGIIDGNNSLTMDISGLDEHEDIDKSNNTLVTGMSFVTNVLIEEFTTENCPNCPRVAGYLHEALQRPDYEGRVFPAAHHDMYYEDWLTLQQSMVDGKMVSTDIYDFARLYNDRGTYAPAVMYNRNAWFTSNSGNDTPVSLPGSVSEIQEVLDYALAQPANATITSLTASYGDNDTTLIVDVEGLAKGVDAKNLRITVMLTEDNINAHDQAGTTTAFVHQHVSRAFNSIWGVPIALDGNKFRYRVKLGLNTQYFTKVEGVTFLDEYRNWKKEDMHVIALLNNNSNNVSACNIVNVESIPFSEVTGIKNIIGGNISEQPVHTEYYSLDGVLLSTPPSHGVFILRNVYRSGKVASKKIVR